MFHLAGGMRAFCDLEGHIEGLSALDKTPIHLQCQAYQDAYSLIRRQGFLIIGMDFYQSAGDLAEFRPSMWRSYAELGDGTATLCADQADQWSFITHRAFQAGEKELCDIAGRIRHQLRACDWRLRQVSECYRYLLQAKIQGGDFVGGKRFNNERTWLAYLELQTFLIDACVLRDYFAEYVSWMLKIRGMPMGVGIRRMARLKKEFLDKTDSDEAFIKALKNAVGSEGWLTELGMYRDLVVHSSPLVHSGKTLWAKTQELIVRGGHRVAAIRLPMPLDPKEISDQRAAGLHLEEPTYGTFAHSVQDDLKHQDGLTYASVVLVRLAWLAWHLSVISPIKPEVVDLTDEITDLTLISGGRKEQGA